MSIIIIRSNEGVSFRMKKSFWLGVLAVFIVTPAFAASNFNISASNPVALLSNTSQYSRVSGTISNIKISENSKVILLNFGKNYNTSFTAVIYDNVIPDFVMAGITEPAEFYENKKVELEGIIRISNGKPEMVIDSPDQIKVID